MTCQPTVHSVVKSLLRDNNSNPWAWLLFGAHRELTRFPSFLVDLFMIEDQGPCNFSTGNLSQLLSKNLGGHMQYHMLSLSVRMNIFLNVYNEAGMIIVVISLRLISILHPYQPNHYHQVLVFLLLTKSSQLTFFGIHFFFSKR